MTMETTNSVAAVHAHQLVNVLAGGWISQAVSVAARIGIADELACGPQSLEALAAKTKSHKPSLYRLLRALASVDIFVERDGQTFDLTPKAAFLQSSHPHSLRAYALMMGNEWVWRSWGDLASSVETGKPAFDLAYGSPLFEYYAKNPEAAQSSVQGLSSRSRQEGEAILRAYDFSSVKSIVDIGGGQGGLLKEILAAHPNVRGTLFDIPHVIQMARGAETAGDSARLEFAAGNFFASMPAGHDLYLMKKVLHDWDDDQARLILGNCRAAIPPHGRLLIVDQIVPAGNGPSYSKLLDLLMLVLSGGRERTEAEHSHLLGSAGFDLTRVIPLMSSLCVIEASPR